MPNGAFVKVSSFTADACAGRAVQTVAHSPRANRRKKKSIKCYARTKFPARPTCAGRWDLRPCLSLIRIYNVQHTAWTSHLMEDTEIPLTDTASNRKYYTKYLHFVQYRTQAAGCTNDI
ncbi:unnamed protein product [Danaus chrysippus]|uniref:(African queen) hypothetical protein n=1 Tax=Danaus chrysippus TaxID=151541 RepID=A0A8J2QFH3_9NEOP|nr:unnamed protein product [Danaus chrysippus]